MNSRSKEKDELHVAKFLPFMATELAIVLLDRSVWFKTSNRISPSPFHSSDPYRFHGVNLSPSIDLSHHQASTNSCSVSVVSSMARRRPDRAWRRSIPDWSSGLPQELLECIGGRLQSGRDAAAFRSVCARWRAALPFARFAPVLLLPFGPGESLEMAGVTFYSVAGEGAFSRDLPEVRDKVLCGSSRGWLALVDEAAVVTLLNPFTGARAQLPPADERVAAASSRSVSMVDGRWVLRPDGDGHGNGAVAKSVKLADMRDVFFREIVLSSPPTSGAAGQNCVAMAVLANSTEVAFCRLGDSAWRLLYTNLECCVNSIVHVQDSRFVTTGCLGEISICDITAGASPTAMPMPSLAPPAQLCHRSYLQVNGELHLVGAVVRASHKARRFTYTTAVYKCDLLDGSTPAAWSRVKDAGDLTLFVSKHFKASLGGASVSRFRRNSVYFSEPLYGHEEEPEHRLEIADIATGRTSELVAYHQKMQRLEAICWIQPNLWREGGQTNC